MKKRKEKDALGTTLVPLDAYYGSFSARAKKNFQISSLSAPTIFRKSLGLVKKAAAISNNRLGLLDKKISTAIIKACDEFIDGKFNEEFTLDIFQAGAGTPFNMNVNEIIANRAGEILGDTKGSYKKVHPNNHVNMAQSTNDVIPTATRIATIFNLVELLQALSELEESIRNFAKKHKSLIKVGRTHLEDAVPISMGQEFLSYADALKKDRHFITDISQKLQELGIGGTAIGTGINTHPKYQIIMVEELSKMTGIKFTAGKNLVELNNNYNYFANLSSALRSLAMTMSRIANDLKLMNMGPKAGIAEIVLAEVEPGSSIMPGKVNPSIPECIEMISCQIVGNDAAINMAIRGGQFELNVNCPVIIHNLLQSVEILTNGCKMFKELCIDKIKVNSKHIENIFKNSLCTATALNPYLGYEVTAEIVNEALKKNISIEETVLHHSLIEDKVLKKLLSVEYTTQARIPDKKLISKIQSSKNFVAFKEKIGK